MFYRSFLFIVFALLIGCSSSTSIRDIAQNSRDYDGKEVTVNGTVTDTFSLVLVKYFMLADDAGNEVPVVTQKGLPSKGQKVTVKGKVSSGFSLGTRTLTVIVENAE